MYDHIAFKFNSFIYTSSPDHPLKDRGEEKRLQIYIDEVKISFFVYNNLIITHNPDMQIATNVAMWYYRMAILKWFLTFWDQFRIFFLEI